MKNITPEGSRQYKKKLTHIGNWVTWGTCDPDSPVKYKSFKCVSVDCSALNTQEELI